MQPSSQSSKFKKVHTSFLALVCALLPVSEAFAADEALPDHLVELAWAYAITIEPPPPLPEDDKKHRLPDAPRTFSRDEIVGRKDGVAFQTAPADWYPGDHPKMPEIYAKGDPARKVIA